MICTRIHGLLQPASPTDGNIFFPVNLIPARSTLATLVPFALEIATVWHPFCALRLPLGGVNGYIGVRGKQGRKKDKF